jgi:hypothetical protein
MRVQDRAYVSHAVSGDGDDLGLGAADERQASDCGAAQVKGIPGDIPIQINGKPL